MNYLKQGRSSQPILTGWYNLAEAIQAHANLVGGHNDLLQDKIIERQGDPRRPTLTKSRTPPN